MKPFIMQLQRTYFEFMRIFLVFILFCFPSYGYEFISSKNIEINSFIDELDESNTIAKRLFSEKVIINKNIILEQSPINTGNILNKNNKFRIKKIKVSNQNFDDSDIFFSADKVLIDNKLNKLTAIGNVKFKFDEIELSSEKIIYSQF